MIIFNTCDGHPGGYPCDNALCYGWEVLMKKLLSRSVLAAALIMSAAPSFAGSCGNDYNVRIYNESSDVVYSLYATNRDDGYWGVDILPEVIYPGESQVVDLDDYSCYCKYDLLAETEDESAYWVRHDVNVCSMTDWTLYD